MERLIGIISLALGLLGGGEIVVSAFFKTDESRQIVISPRKKLLLVICLVGICLGIALLIYGIKNSEPAIKYNEDWSVEKLVEVNYDAILQKKDGYRADDAIKSENRYVNLLVCENAGTMYTYSGDMKEISSESLGGRDLPDVQVVLFDYEDNHVIASYRSDEKGGISHYAQKGDRFYCAVVTAEYELYVSPPIFVIGTEEVEYSGLISLYLKKADDAYLSPHFVRVNVRDQTQSEPGYSALQRGYVNYRCIEKNCVDHESFDSMFYSVYTNESGFLSNGGEERYCFELNDRYELDMELNLKDASTNMTPYFYDGVYTTVEEFPDSSNVIDVYFDYDGEKWTLYQS